MCIRDSHVTEACVLTAGKHPVSVFSMIHSSAEKDYKSVNTITFDAIRQAAALFGKATFVMDRGYDDNKMFLILGQLKQDYVIRLKSCLLYTSSKKGNVLSAVQHSEPIKSGNCIKEIL